MANQPPAITAPPKRGRGKPKGLPRSGGMVKGQRLHRVLEWQEFGRQVIEGGLPRVMQYMDQLPDDKHFANWVQLIEYFKPRLARTEVNADVNNNHTVSAEVTELLQRIAKASENGNKQPPKA
jgi:hypothetical protein